MELSKPQNELYFNTQKDSEKVLIFFDHEDKLGKSLKHILDQFCRIELVEVPCFSAKNGEDAYEKYASRFVVNVSESAVAVLTNFH